MRSPAEIVALHNERRARHAPEKAVGARIIAAYDGDMKLALPELEPSEQPAVANLIQSGIDQHAMRIASVLPTPCFVPMRVGETEERRVRDRHDIMVGWWTTNHMNLLMRRRARLLVALATSPISIRPGSDGIPRWHIRDPLCTYPAPGLNPDELYPPDCIFTFRRSYDWLRARYDITSLATGQNVRADTMFDCLEYLDDEQITLIALGKQDAYSTPNPGLGDIVLASAPNLAGVPLAVVPGRINIGKLQGQFDQMLGMYLASAKLWGLHLHAVSRSIFAETWLQSNPGEQAEVIVEADPLAGQTGLVRGGHLTTERPDPGVQTLAAIDRLERNQRVTGTVPAEFGGEGGSGIRTARRGDQLMSSSVDYPVQEHQELLAASLEQEDRIAIAVAKAHAGSRLVNIPIPGQRAKLAYTANAIFENTDHSVEYAYAGTDTNGLVIEFGQRLGMGTISKERFMEVDPMIRNLELEKDRMVVEALNAAFLSSIQTQAADPQGPFQPADFAKLIRMVRDDKEDLPAAVEKIHAEIQQRQAAAAQQQATPAQLQPGLSAPGAPGTAQALAPVQGPNDSQQNLLRLLGSLRLPQRQTPAEVASPTG